MKRRDTLESKLILDGHKLAWHKDRVDAWLAGERVAPITIDCALTRNCNFKCQYCYGQLQENKRQILTRNIIYRFLDDAAEIGVKGISFVSDGESTLSPHLKNAILHGKSNGIDMALGTNGSLLRWGDIDDLVNNLTYLRFNISAGDPIRFAEIHGVKPSLFWIVADKIKACVQSKRNQLSPCTIGIQMVLMPGLEDQILPLAELGKSLGVDYFIIKHCSDDENGSLKIDYSKYKDLDELLRKAEEFTTNNYLVKAKWSKIMSDGKRSYTQCYGPPFIMQFSGSGLVAPCGMLFNDKYSEYHIGNIAEKSFKEIWKSDRYWEVINLLASDKFNAHTMCGTLCLQHKVNEYLWDIKNGGDVLEPEGDKPEHINFI